MPFSNLNRDDLGSPKALTFGGVQRTRISSQCWKRATRSDMEAALTGAPGYDRAVRTRKPVDILANELVAKGWDAKDATHAARVTFGPFLAAEKAKNDEDDEPSTGGSNVLLFLTMSQYADLAVLADQGRLPQGRPGQEGEDVRPATQGHRSQDPQPARPHHGLRPHDR